MNSSCPGTGTRATHSAPLIRLSDEPDPVNHRESSRPALHRNVSLFPLETFCRDLGHPIPDTEQIVGRDMPEPYRGLLVHDDDMTPTLELFHDSEIHLRLLNQRNEPPFYQREVVLVLDTTGKAVEYGAIRIHLDVLPERARSLVLEAKVPLGTILATECVAHQNHPASYLRVFSTPTIEAALGLTETTILYGRRNIIHKLAGKPLAEVLEILPP